MKADPRFITELDMCEADCDIDNGRWKLCKPLVYSSVAANTVIVVPAGFATDLASVPRVPVAYVMCGGRASKPAVVHDWLYSSGELPRNIADAVFLEAMGVVGVPWLYRHMMWAGVRIGGSSHYINK